MKTELIKNGSRSVVIVADRVEEQAGESYHVSARLYVNNGETATLTCWKGKTLAGARRWAHRQLAAN